MEFIRAIEFDCRKRSNKLYLAKNIWPIVSNRNFNIANSVYANPAMERPAVAQIHGMKLQYLHGIELHGMKINDVC